MKREFKVSKQERGMKLLSFLRYRWPSAPSVKALKRAIDKKRCTIDGRIETFSTHTLAEGSTVVIELVQEKILRPTILYEDEAIVVCNKPAGIVSESKNFPALLVHRLDKETSGALILAKAEPVRRKMIDLFTQSKVKKQYLALVDGVVLKKEGQIVSHLTKKRKLEGQTVYASSLKGKEAITKWRCLTAGKKASLLLCEPITGRTHQLRVHMKEMGHPLLGDTQYAKRFSCQIYVHRQMLHAFRLTFPHPETGKIIEVTVPIPEDFVEALENVGMAYLAKVIEGDTA